MAIMTADDIIKSTSGAGNSAPAAEGQSYRYQSGYQPFVPEKKEVAPPESTGILSRFYNNQPLSLSGKVGRALVGDMAEASYQGTQAVVAGFGGQVEQVGQQNIISADDQFRAAMALNTRKDLTQAQRNALLKIAKGGFSTNQEIEEVAPIIKTTGTQLAGTIAKGGIQAVSDISMAGGGLPGTKPVINPTWAAANPVRAAILSRYIPAAVTGGVFAGSSTLASAVEKKGAKIVESKEDFTETAKDVAMGTAFGAGFAVAMTGAMDLTSWGFRTAYQKLAGVPKGAVDRLIEDKTTIEKVREMTKNDLTAQNEMVDDYVEGLNTLKTDKNTKYNDWMAQTKDRVYIGESAPPKGYDSSGLDYSLPKDQLSQAFREKANGLLNAKGQPMNKELFDFYNYQADNVMKTTTLSAAEKAGNLANPLDSSKAYKGSGTEFESKKALWWMDDSGNWTKTNLTAGGIKQKANQFILKPGADGGLGITKGADGSLNFNSAKISEQAASPILSAKSVIDNWDDFTPMGINRLKQRIMEGYNVNPTTNGEKAVNSMLQGLKENIDEYIVSKIGKNNPITTMNRDYSEAMTGIKAIETELGKGTDTQTQFNKLIALTREKTPLKVAQLSSLDEKTSQSLLDSLYAYTMASWMNRNRTVLGLEAMGALAGGGYALGSGNIPAAGVIVAGAALSSPRLGAEIISATAPVAQWFRERVRDFYPVISSNIGKSFK